MKIGVIVGGILPCLPDVPAYRGHPVMLRRNLRFPLSAVCKHLLPLRGAGGSIERMPRRCRPVDFLTGLVVLSPAGGMTVQIAAIRAVSVAGFAHRRIYAVYPAIHDRQAAAKIKSHVREDLPEFLLRIGRRGRTWISVRQPGLQSVKIGPGRRKPEFCILVPSRARFLGKILLGKGHMQIRLFHGLSHLHGRSFFFSRPVQGGGFRLPCFLLEGEFAGQQVVPYMFRIPAGADDLVRIIPQRLDP